MTRRILYIEDNPDDVYAAIRSFSNLNIDLKCVPNPDDAFAEMKQKKYDVIVCDMMMPGEDGLFFAKQMAKENIETPLILTSGIFALRGFHDYHGLKNYLGFMLKPITPEKIENLLGET